MASALPASVNGVTLPKNAKGDRSSTAFGKKVLAGSVRSADATVSSAIEAETNWRFGYAPHFLRVSEMALESRQAAFDIASQGLAHALELAEFVRGEETVPLKNVLSKYPGTESERAFATGKVQGSGLVATSITVPYRGEQLTNDRASQQLDAWAARDCMEPSCAAAVKAVIGDTTGFDLTGHQFVVLGAGSELGPFELLLAAGATVLAVGTRRPERWQRYMAIARASAGTLLFPLAPGTEPIAEDVELGSKAGCDLSADLPEVVAWLLQNLDGQKPLTVGTYIYADGEANVRLTLASDIIIQAITATTLATPPTFAWLLSMSMPCALPPGAYESSKEYLDSAPWWQKVLFLEPNNSGDPVSGSGIRIHNGIVNLQGPNYLLAQQLRVWRASELLGRGLRISANYAPPSRTESVVHNRTLKVAMGGYAHIPPLEAFDAATVKAVMFALLVSDIKSGGTSSTTEEDKHPLVSLSEKAFHGGSFRCAWRSESLGKTLYVLGWLNGKDHPSSS